MKQPDRWHLMALHLVGEPPPPPPRIRGRTFRAVRADDTDPGLADMLAAELWRDLAKTTEQDEHQ